MRDYLYLDDNDDAHQTKFKVSDTEGFDYLFNEKRYPEALNKINEMLKTDSGYENWNLKGKVLDRLSRFDEAVRCYDKSLKINPTTDTLINKANTLYNWAKVTFFPEANYRKARELIDMGINTLPDTEDPSEFYFLKAEILEGQNNLPESYKCYLIAYQEHDKLKEFEKQTSYLKSTADTLLNIAGSSYYSYTPKTGDILTLVKDDENEHDRDAIAVVKDSETVGYVANNDYTLINEVKSASSIRNSIHDNQKIEILFTYIGEYVIARLISG